MKTILLIAQDSIRALLHHRLLVALMLASLALTAIFSVVFSKTKATMSENFMDQVMTNSASGTTQMSELDRRKFREQMEAASSGFQAAFYGVASFAGSLVALFIFSTAVTTEIRKGTIRLTLSKRVSRTQFLLGKYCGGVVVMAGYALIATLAMLLFAGSQGMELSPAMKFAPWLMFCRQLMLGAVAMLLSLFVHPIIASVLAFFSGNGLYSPYNPLYFLLPSYREFNLIGQLFSGTLVSFREVGYLTLYAADIVAIILLLAIWRFSRKELV